MEHDPEELSRERAASSEPSVRESRTYPFDSDNEPSSRKRPKLSSSGSPTRPSETTTPSSITPDTTSQDEPMEDSAPPRTPTRSGSAGGVKQPTETPTSSRVTTLNLRAGPLEPTLSSPLSPATPSQMPYAAEDTSMRKSVESESDALSCAPAMETPSSSSSSAGNSPEIEVVSIQDDSPVQSPAVHLIDDPDLDVNDYANDIMLEFPWNDSGSEGELLVILRRISTHFRNEPIDSCENFDILRKWITKFLTFTKKHEGHPYHCFEAYFDRHREFWSKFPEIIWALCHRRIFFNTFLVKDRASSRPLAYLFCEFAKLSARFAVMDAERLSQYSQVEQPRQDPILGSAPFLYAFGHLVLPREGIGHIGKNLELHYSWLWDEDLQDQLASFLREGGSIALLTKLVKGQLHLIRKTSKGADTLYDPCRIVHWLAEDAQRMVRGIGSDREKSRKVIAQAYEFFKIMSSGFEALLDKSATIMVPDIANCILFHLNTIYSIALQTKSESTRALLEAKQDECNTIPVPSIWQVVATEWKMSVLEKFIKSSQMQLRVIGVTGLCDQLLTLHTAFKGHDPAGSPCLRHFALIIQRDGIIEHLFSTTSHPEIISESYNILGFLVVTKTYLPCHASTIWNTITNSQDRRIVEATLKMLKHVTPLQDTETSLEVCEKVNTLPLQSFTPAMRSYLQELFKDLLHKCQRENMYMDIRPYNLCVRLIRDSSIVTAETPLGEIELQKFATDNFCNFLHQGPTPKHRNELAYECATELTTSAPTAAGSLTVIHCLMRRQYQHGGVTLRVLIHECNLTEMVIQELASAMSHDGYALQAQHKTPVYVARKGLISSIIDKESGTLSENLGRQLWNLLVGESSCAPEREAWWHILNEVMTKSSGNGFIAACFEHHLPTLPPQCFTVGALEFAHAAILAWMFDLPNKAVEDQIFDSPALEQLWRIILTAHPNTVDAKAIEMLVDDYLSSRYILSLPLARARTLHLGLVNRCLSQLASAAMELRSFTFDKHSLDGPAEAFELAFREQETIFARSLAVLREFMKGYQSSKRFSTPKPRADPPSISSAVEGDEIDVKYQCFTSNSNTEIMSLTLGTLNTAASLFASLEKGAGFQNYKVYCGGRELDPDAIDLCKSIQELNIKGLVIVQQREGSDFTPRLSGNETSLERAIMDHFDNLWGYLEMHEKVAQEIYYFLEKFPVYEELLKGLASDSMQCCQIFPRGKPFKSMYALYALREYLAQETSNGVIEKEALSKAMTLLVTAISDPTVLEDSSEALQQALVLELLELLLQLVKEPVLPDTVASLLRPSLMDRLVMLLEGAILASTSETSIRSISRIFEVMLEASGHSHDLWTRFHFILTTSPLLANLVLRDSRRAVRKSIVKLIVASIGPASSTTYIKEWWTLASALIHEAVDVPEQCEELFSICHHLFKKLAEANVNCLDLQGLVSDWGNLLISQPNKINFTSPEHLDPVAYGLVSLCHCAASFRTMFQKPFSCGSIAVALFKKHLFPPLATDSNHEVMVPKLPLLNTSIRHTLAEAIVFMIGSDSRLCDEILSLLQQLLPYATTLENPYMFEYSWQYDRKRSIRSPAGYVGLRNLSNTCYLNSLFTQLYMNVPFREFMLAAPTDSLADQELLRQTKYVFGNMQNSFARFADPQALTQSLRTYDDGLIDINVQMDVDEFYNLLFDRWEAQMVSSDAKRTFKSFYGGQLGQQIKSKECGHISERLESFSAIQCDVKGKGTLEDSLKAYVDGEVMEGDNKIKCGTCDAYHDAVKRACLKDVPDHLIFHLKRFEYDLVKGIRSKVNDYFSFPTKIDMQPYKVESIMNGLDTSSEDVFELVGVLVHAGNAESGHYYSFIKERPSTHDKETWIEFNDDTVTSWDSKRMEDQCFGGTNYGNDMMPDKNFSAYMLFYERSSVLAEQKEALSSSAVTTPLRVTVERELSNHLAMENEHLMRRYCLYDPSQTDLVAKMLSTVQNINKGSCSEDHGLEEKSLDIAFNHLDQVVSRTKDLPEFSGFIADFSAVFLECAECSRDVLGRVTSRIEAARNLLLKNPEPVIRNETRLMILATLAKIREDSSPDIYGLPVDENSLDLKELEGDPYGGTHLVQQVVLLLEKFWDAFPANPRSWPDYFGLLLDIANLGPHESALLIHHGFLEKCLEIVEADPENSSSVYNRMLNIVKKRAVSGRPVSLDAALLLLDRLLQMCDFTPPYKGVENRSYPLYEGRVSLSRYEHTLITRHWTHNGANVLVEKLLSILPNPAATKAILTTMLRKLSIDKTICKAIEISIKSHDTSLLGSGHALHAAFIYCCYSRNPDGMWQMIDHVVSEAAGLQTESIDGKDYLDFFQAVMDGPANAGHFSKGDIIMRCMDRVATWAPALLNHYDQDVREGTRGILTQYLFQPSALEPIEEREPVIAIIQFLGMGCLEFLNNRYIVPHRQAVKTTIQTIVSVIEDCSMVLESVSDDESVTAKFNQMSQTILPALSKVSVEELDEDISDWDGSDAEYDTDANEPIDDM